MKDKRMSCVIIVPSSTAQFDIAAGTVATLISTLSGSGLYIDSGAGDYDLQNDSFTHEEVLGDLDNLKNPKRTHKLSFLSPVHTGGLIADKASRAAFIAVGALTAGTYDVYTFDPYSGTDGRVSRYYYAKVNVDEMMTPDGAVNSVTVETKNENNYFSTEVVQA